MSRLIVKNILKKPSNIVISTTEVEKNTTGEKKNKKGKKNEEDMMNEEVLSEVEAQASALSNNVKVTKKDRSIIERAESSKIILTEDNRQILND